MSTIHSFEKTDGELLADFLAGRREGFEEVVRRHGAMVYGVCVRIVRNRHDAEDAAQAAFLALAMKADGLRSWPSVGAWLHRAARLLSLKTRTKEMRWQRGRSDVDLDVAGVGSFDGAVDRDELKQILDEELDRLPEKYRVPLVLHHLEGLTQEEAARQLGCKPGTLASWLNRGRKILGERLVKRGVAVAAVALLLRGGSAEAAPVGSFVQATADAAMKWKGGAAAGTAASSSLAGAFVQMLFWAKVKTAVAAILAIAAIGGVVTLFALKLGTPAPAVAAAGGAAGGGADGRSATQVPGQTSPGGITLVRGWTGGTPGVPMPIGTMTNPPAGGAQRTVVVGKIAEVRTNAVVITTSGQRGEPQMVTVPVAAGTVILVDGRAASLQAMTAGQQVRMSVDRSPAGAVQMLRVEAMAASAVPFRGSVKPQATHGGLRPQAVLSPEQRVMGGLQGEGDEPAGE